MTSPGYAWPAPAKLNLFLHVTGQRADGYHHLQTLFQILDWGDELFITATADGKIRRTTPIPGVSEEEDLSVRAAQLLQRECACRQGASIKLIKRIPMGAGLGGGSSDAATVLHALNQIWGCGLSVSELAVLAVTLGADVPVFVHGFSAWAEGIGEQLQPFALGETWYVLILPEIQVSTSAVFRDPGLKRDANPVQSSGFMLGNTRNVCEEVVFRLFPELHAIWRDLSAYGTPRLTGTGSCIFLPFAKKNHADSITTELKSRYNVRAVRGVDRSPLLAKLSGVS
jgi:4-diphosphocytidyl-2-C-methyl-D-erythritol kinase